MSEGKKPLKFGSISSPGGALYAVRPDSAEDDLSFVHYEFLIASLVNRGVPITPQVEQIVRDRAREKAKEIIADHRAKGVSEVYRKLFEIEKKKEAERFASSLIVDHSEFSLLVSNCDQIGYVHQRHHSQIVPQELKPTESEREGFFNNGVGPFKTIEAKKFIKKIMAGFKQRKNVNAHLFEKEGKWHIFWFTFDDLHAGAKGEKPHWDYGDHVHYTSYLWKLRKEEVWSQLKSGKYKINGLHLRYIDEARK